MNIVVDLSIQVLSFLIKHLAAKLSGAPWPPDTGLANGVAAPWVTQFFSMDHEAHCDYLNGLKIGPWSLVYVVQFLSSIFGVHVRDSLVMNIGNGEFYEAL